MHLSFPYRQADAAEVDRQPRPDAVTAELPVLTDEERQERKRIVAERLALVEADEISARIAAAEAENRAFWVAEGERMRAEAAELFGDIAP